MGKFDGVLLVSDYDDTLRAGSRQDVSKENLDAIDYFCSEGGKFTVCTGRDLCSYLMIRDVFKVNAPVILSNGAVIYDGASDEIVYETFLPDNADEIIKALMEKYPTCGFEIHTGAKLNLIKNNPGTQLHLSGNLAETEEVSIDEVPRPWNKFSVYMPDHPVPKGELIDRVLADINEHFDGFKSRGMIDASLKGITKGTGALKAGELLGVSREHLYTVGDSWNDIPMLKAAKIGFAPENAEEESKAAADMVVCSAENHAIRDVINILSSIY